MHLFTPHMCASEIAVHRSSIGAITIYSCSRGVNIMLFSLAAASLGISSTTVRNKELKL